MTREEMWKEFENQLISETRTPITMSFDNAEKLTKLGIKETVAKWKKRLEQTRWIPVKFRPLTDKEKEEHPDYCYMADCQMPDDGEEILVTTTYGNVEKDIAYFEDGFCLDSGYDWEDITAWMPLPQPYKAESEE